MKNFLTFITEDLLKKNSVAWQGHVFDLVFHHSDTGVPDWIPITTKTTEALFGQTHKIHTLHVTDSDGLKGLISIAGSKKTISSTTTAHYDSILTGNGIHRGGIIACVTGDFVLGHTSDLMTVPDNNGRRWITLHFLTTEYTEDNRGQVSSFLRQCQTLKKEIMKRYEKALQFDTDERIDRSNKNLAVMPYHSSLYTNNPHDRDEVPLYYESVWLHFGLTCKAHSDTKILGSVIKDYVDGMNKLVLNFKSLFADFLSSHTTASGYYNEILINNIQIKGIFVDTGSYNITARNNNISAFQKMADGKFPIITFDSNDYHDKALTSKRLNFLKHFVDTGVFNSAT